MVVTGEDYGLFFNSINGDRTYDASSFENWLKKFFTSGVFTGDLQVLASSGMTVNVGTGYANVDGKVRIWNSITPITLEAANSTYPRIDTIVITRDNTNRQIILEAVTGQYSGDTPVPTAPVRNAEKYQMVLAQIYVGNSVTEITQANITDTRTDTDLCGIVTGTVQEMDFSQFVTQFEAFYNEFITSSEAEFDAWEAEQQVAFTTWMNGEKSDFDYWFANLQYVLDGDVAGHLQNEIDAIEEGLAGSVFTIHTSNSRLYGKTILCTGATQTKSAVFDATGNAEITGVTDIGDITFTATDGTDVATTVINVPYFGKYSVSMAFWSATVTLTTNCPEAYGKTISVKKGGATIASTSFNALGEATYIASSSGTYSFSVNVDGFVKTESTTLTTDGQTASVALNFGTINLTFDDAFRNEDISCVSGGTTITKTAPASGNTMTFYPPTTGNWTISGEVSGTTYVSNPNPVVVSSLSTAVSAQLQTMVTKSVTMYGGAGSIITWTNADGSAGTATMNSNGTNTVSITIIPTGSSITFTDTNIAKNPNNLSQNYTKTITVTNATTEIKVMPDNAIYWYGYGFENADAKSNGWNISIGGFTYSDNEGTSMLIQNGSGMFRVFGSNTKPKNTNGTLYLISQLMYNNSSGYPNDIVALFPNKELANAAASYNLTSDTKSLHSCPYIGGNYVAIDCPSSPTAVRIFACWVE